MKKVTPASKKVKIPISDTIGSVSGLVLKPSKCKVIMVLAHGAGAGMSHPFMESLAAGLSAVAIGTVRFNFPFMDKKKGRPDPPAIAEKTVASAVAWTHKAFPSLPVVVAGKSFGGRMASRWLAKESPSYVQSIVFYGFPLHPAGQPSMERAAHLPQISIPMLFLQGTRDALAEMSLMEKVCAGLPEATLIKLEGADHSFRSAKIDWVQELVRLTDLQLK